MARILPLRTEPDLEHREPRLVDLQEEAADEVFDALSSRTAREIHFALHEEPRPASEIAEAVDTSVQNVQYHLEKLGDADLIEGVDTWYSETGVEMQVYAPSDEALVLVAGRRPHSSLRRILERLVGAVLPVVMVAMLAWHRMASAGVDGGATATTDAPSPSGGDDVAATEAAAGDAAAGTERSYVLNESAVEYSASSANVTLDSQDVVIVNRSALQNASVVTDGAANASAAATGGADPALLAGVVLLAGAVAIAGYLGVAALQRRLGTA